MIPPELKDTGENPSVEGMTPTQIVEEAQTPASVRWVKDQLHEHHQTCPAGRAVRKARLWLVFGFGVWTAATALGAWAIKSEIRATVLELKEQTRAMIREELSGKAASVSTPKPAGFNLISSAHASEVRDAGR